MVFVVFVIKDAELIHVVLNFNLFSQFLENADKIPNFKTMGYLPKKLKKSSAFLGKGPRPFGLGNIELF